MKVSAQATPMPETMPERRLFESVRWMQSTATGPTVIEAATPTQMPRNRTSTMSNAIFYVSPCSVERGLILLSSWEGKDTKKLRFPRSGGQKKGEVFVPSVGR